jgi:hypothetical protein
VLGEVGGGQRTDEAGRSVDDDVVLAVCVAHAGPSYRVGVRSRVPPTQTRAWNVRPPIKPPRAAREFRLPQTPDESGSSTHGNKESLQ